MKRAIIIISLIIISGSLFSQAWMQNLPQSKAEKDLTFFDYQAAFKQWCQEIGIDNEGYFINNHGEKQKAYGWKQFRRWEEEMKLLGNFNTTTGEFIKARAMDRVLPELRNPSGPSDNLAGNWTNLGYSVTSSGYHGIGRLNTIAFHPTDPDKFWVGAPRGGIWVTNDHGSTWTPLSDNIAQIGISAIAIPSDYDVSNTIYIGTGDRGHWSDKGVGILKSTDGGNTWLETSLTRESLEDFYIGRILIHPDNDQVQFAGTSEGVYYTTNGWLSKIPLTTDKVIDMEFHPTNHEIIYASTRELNGHTNIKRSLNGGDNWQVIMDVAGLRTEIAVSPDEPDWIYAIVSAGDGGLKGIYLSTDAGDSFTQQLDGSVFGNNILAGDCAGNESGGQGSYDLCIAVNPMNAEDLWIGGIDTWNSVDAGLSWDLVGHWTDNCGMGYQVIHADHHWLEFQPGSEKIFDCNDGGIYFMEYGQSFNLFFDISEGLSINQIYHLSNSQQHADEIIMGLQDNSTVLWSGGDYTRWNTGDGTDCLINPDDDNIQYYCGYAHLPTFTLMHWAFSDGFHVNNDSSQSWFKAFRLQPSSTNVVYFGLSNLYKSTDFGDNFSLFYDPPDLSQINEIAISASNPDVILFSNATNLYKTADAGTTWEVLTDNLPFGPTIITEIVIKNDDENTIWITITGWAANHVFETKNGGSSWFDISDGLPEAPLLDLIQNTAESNYTELYAAGFYGVYVKLGEQDWIPFNAGLPNLTVNDIDIYYAGNKLRAATWGRGFWESGLFSPESGMPGIWTGVYSTDWNDFRNWQYMDVPSFNEDVTIPAGCQRYPNIRTSDATCKNITVEEGVRLNISGHQLTVMENMNILGDLRMIAPDSKLEVHQDLSFEENSVFYANNSTNLQIEIYRNLYFRPGVEGIKFDSVAVSFTGEGFSTIFSDGNNCGFGNININKTLTRSVSVDGNSTKQLFVNGNMTIGPDAKFNHNSEMYFNLGGNLNAFGDFFFQHGKFNLLGGDKEIYLAHSNSYMNDFQCNMFSASEATMLSDIQIRGNLTLLTGTLNAAGYNLKLNEDLIKINGNLLPGTGRVTFDGNGPQTMTGGEFQFCIFDLAKTGDTLFLSSDVTANCSYYNYTSGIFKVEDDAVFAASDLLQNGIFGHFILKDRAQINLSKSAGSINLNGILKIYAGNFNVFGGTSTSFWPGSMNSELWISGGVLDFKDNGIFLSNSFNLLEVITGGVIRTSGSFISERNDFTPVGGYIELYGPDNVSLSHGIGSAFWDLKINKAASTDQCAAGPAANKKAPPPAGTRAQKVTVIQDLEIDHDLNILSGALDINGRTVECDRTLDISGTLTMTNPAGNINVGQNVIWRPGSGANITEGLITFKTSWNYQDGTNAQLSGNNTVKAIGNSNTDIYHKDADACFANFTAEKTGLNMNLDIGSSYPMRVNGTLTVMPANNFLIGSAALIVNGTMILENTANVILQSGGNITTSSANINNSLNIVNGSFFNGTSMTVAGTLNLTDGGMVSFSNLTLNGTLDINAGSVMVHNSFTQATGGHLILDGGSFIIDKPYTGTMFGFSGTTDLNGGFFEISYDGIQFGTGAVVNFNGGNLRVGGHFSATNPGSFQPTAGAVEFINTLGSNITCNNGNYFHKVIINKNAGANPCLLTAPVTIQDDLTLQSGELSTLNQTLTMNNDLLINTSGKLTAGSSEIHIGGDWTNNRGTIGFNEGTSSVWFTSAQPATLGSETFYRLDIDKALSSGQYLTLADGAMINVLNKMTLGDGTLLMGNNSTLTANAELMIKNGAGLNANPSAAGVVINSFGPWEDYNSVADANNGFYCGNSRVYMKGSAEQEIISGTGVTFYDLVVQKSVESFLPSCNITVLNDLDMQTGNWSYGTIGLTHSFKGDFIIGPGASWDDAQNIVSFTGNQMQGLINNSGNPLHFNTLVVNQPDGGGNYGSLDILSGLNCNVFKILDGYTSVDNEEIICTDSLAILNDGILSLEDGLILKMGNAASFYINGGTLNISGSSSHQVLITRENTGNFEFLVENGGTIQAAYTIFEYMDDRGLDIEGTGRIEGTFPFSHCTLRKGQASGSLLIINNSQDITLHDVNFPANTWSGTSNIAKNTNAGNVYLPNASGDFAGPYYEYDPNNRIHWPSSGIWDGDFSTSWHDAKNWRYDAQSPDVNTDVVIPAGTTYSPIFSAQEVTVKSLRMEPNTSLTFQKDSLTVTSFADISGSMVFTGENTSFFADSLIWQSGSSASMIDKSTIYISGDMFIRQGSNLTLKSGLIYYYGNGESTLRCHDTAQVHNLSNYKNAPHSLSLAGDTVAQLTIDGNFINGTNATLKCPSTQEWVFNGNFRNTDNGHFRCANGTFRFKGPVTSTYFRVKQGDYFNNLTIETPSRINLYTTTGYSDTLRVNGNLVFNNPVFGTSGLTANNFKIMLMGHWINNASAAAFQAGTSRVTFQHPWTYQDVYGTNTFNYILTANEPDGQTRFYDNTTVTDLVVYFPAVAYGNLNVTNMNIDDTPSEMIMMDGSNVQAGTLIQGGKVISNGGSFTVTDLNEDFIVGTYIVHGGLVSLGQVYNPTATHDLNSANITIDGGELRFTGGNGVSLWPRTGAVASVTMSGGTFDLTNQEVFIRSTGFTENITGGMIRTFWGFSADPAAESFHPTGGIVELYGSEDCSFSMPEPNCWFYNLYLNKTDGGGAYPFSNMRIKNEFRLKTGSYMETDGYTITVGP